MTLEKPLTADEVGRVVPLAQTAVGVLPPCELTDTQTASLLEALSRRNELSG